MNNQPTSIAPTMPVVAVPQLFEEEDAIFCAPEVAPPPPCELRVIFDHTFRTSRSKTGDAEDEIREGQLIAFLGALGQRIDTAIFAGKHITIVEQTVANESGGALHYEITIAQGAFART